MEKLGIIEGTLSSQFGDLVAYEFFKNLALSALGIFIPIIILDASGSLAIAGLYLLVKSITSLGASVVVMNYLAGHGFEKGLYLSYLFLIPSILLLRFLDYSLGLVLAVAVLYSVGKTLHAEAKRLEFTENTTDGDRNKRSADITSIPNLGRFLGPLIAGSLSALFGFNALLTFAIAMIGLSLIPLSKLEKSAAKSQIKVKEIFKQEYRNFIPILTARGIQGIGAVALYGLFTYEFISGSFGSGFVRSLDTIGFVLVAYFSAWITDKISRKKVIAIGSTAASITYAARAFVTTPFQGFLVAFIGGIAFKLYHIPIFSQLADEAESTSETEFFALSRVCTSLGMILATGIFIFMLGIGDRIAFQTIFLIAALATLTIPMMESRL
jgi:MFS family permease